MAVAGLVNADASMAVLVVVLTGLLGANAGAARLAGYKVQDPVTKGKSVCLCVCVCLCRERS
jgi:putative effector of murein hydrolase